MKKSIFFICFYMKKIFLFFFVFLFYSTFFLFSVFHFYIFICRGVLLLCVLIRVITKTKWRVAESKIVFDAVHGCPAVSAVAADAAAADRFPNVVCECVVEDLWRAIDFASSAAANAVSIFGSGGAKRGRGNLHDWLLLLFFGVGEHNPVRRVRKHNARLFAGIFQTLLKVLGHDTWNPE